MVVDEVGDDELLKRQLAHPLPLLYHLLLHSYRQYVFTYCKGRKTMIDNNKRVYKKWMNRRVVVWNIQMQLQQLTL